MIVLCGDTETTGLNVFTDRIIEIGAVLWDTDRKAPLRIFNELVYTSNYPDNLDPIITTKTGITIEDLKLYSMPTFHCFGIFLEMVEKAEVIVGHNFRDFDRHIINHNCRREGIDGIPFDKVIIDTMTDLPIPEDITTRNLVHLCAEHGLVNPFRHRALFDCMSTLNLLSQYPFDQVLALAREESVILIALVDFCDKDKAKERKFRWDNDNKIWQKRVKRSQVEKEERECGFLIERLPDDGRKI